MRQLRSRMARCGGYEPLLDILHLDEQLFLDEIRDELERRTGEAFRSACRALQRLGWSKKNLHSGLPPAHARHIQVAAAGRCGACSEDMVNFARESLVRAAAASSPPPAPAPLTGAAPPTWAPRCRCSTPWSRARRRPRATSRSGRGRTTPPRARAPASRSSPSSRASTARSRRCSPRASAAPRRPAARAALASAPPAPSSSRPSWPTRSSRRGGRSAAPRRAGLALVVAALDAASPAADGLELSADARAARAAARDALCARLAASVVPALEALVQQDYPFWCDPGAAASAARSGAAASASAAGSGGGKAGGGEKVEARAYAFLLECGRAGWGEVEARAAQPFPPALFWRQANAPYRRFAALLLAHVLRHAPAALSAPAASAARAWLAALLDTDNFHF